MAASDCERCEQEAILIRRSQTCARAVLLLFLLAGAGASQELTETEAIQLLRESSRVKERRARLASSDAASSRRSAYPGPSLNASFEGAGRTEFYFVEQELLLGARDTAAKGLSALSADAERARADFDTDRMLSSMLAEFYRLVYAQERIRVILDGIAEQERIGQDIRAQEASGNLSPHDVFMAGQSVAELRVSTLESEIAAAQAKAALADLLGDQVAPETLRAKGSLGPAQDLIPFREALAAALANRADLRSAAAMLEAARLEASAATRGWKPSVKLQGGIKRADIGDRLAVGPFVGVSMPVPLPGGRMPRDRAASSKQTLRQEQIGVLRNQIAAEMRVAHDTLRIRRAAADGYREDVLEPARQLRESRLARYREGESNPVDLLESERVALAAELRSLELRALAKAAEIQFRQVIGNAGLD